MWRIAKRSVFSGWRGTMVPPCLWACLGVGVVALAGAPAAWGIEIVCHRGANEYAPENTRAAAQLCIDWGCDYVEIDVRTNREGVFYIMHDPTVNRTTNGKGLVRQMSCAELDALDAGSWKDPKYAGEHVPRLDEYLRWIKGKIKVYFDVKDADLAKLVALVREVGLENDCFFWCNTTRQSLRLRELDAQMAMKVNIDSVDDVAGAVERFHANIVEVGLGSMSQELLEACHARGLKVMIYHPGKHPEAYRQIVRWRVDMVNLDHGDLFQQIAREEAGSEPKPEPAAAVPAGAR